MSHFSDPLKKSMNENMGRRSFSFWKDGIFPPEVEVSSSKEKDENICCTKKLMMEQVDVLP